MAMLTCNCGNVKMRFANSMPRYSAKCCCMDCVQKMLWCENQGGPAVPHAVAKHRAPVILKYVDNRFEVVQGQDRLRFFKIREGASSTNCVADCCHTLMLVDHPCYEGNTLLTFPEVSTWHGLKERDYQIYFWVKDLCEEDYLKLEPKLPGMYVDHTAPLDKQPVFVSTLAGSLRAGEPPDGLGFSTFMAVHSVAPPAGPGVQFKDLQGSQSPTVLELVESDCSHCKKCICDHSHHCCEHDHSHHSVAHASQAEGIGASSPKMFVRHVSYGFKLSKYDDVNVWLKANMQGIRGQPGVVKFEVSICPSGRLGAYYTFSDFDAFKTYMESEYYIKLKSALMSQPFFDDSKESVVFVGFLQPM